MPAPKIVSIAVEGPDKYIAVDSQGRVWLGKIAISRGKSGDTVVRWERIGHEFSGEGS